MPAIIESLENIEINNKEMVEKHGPNQVITGSINKQAVKKIFKLKILELLIPRKIANAAKFYSNKSGLKAHQVIVESEKSVTECLDNE